MACKKITRTNDSDSELIKTLENIFDNEFKAEEAYSYFDIEEGSTSDFIEEFGDYIKGYKEGDPSFHGRVDENGEPKLFFDEDVSKYYYLDKNKEKIFYPLEKRGLRSLFDYKQMDKIISRLALNYFKKSGLDFNNIKFEEGEQLPRLEEHVKLEIENKIKELNTQGVKGKVLAKTLSKSLAYTNEYVEKIDSFYKQISIKRVDNEEEEASLQTMSEEVKDPAFNTSSFEKDSKQSLTTNIKLRLSLLENKDDLDPVWNEPTFVSFNDVYSTLINNITNQVAINGEDIFDLQRNKIQKLSFKKKYLTQLVDFFNDKRFTEKDKNQFAQTFNIHKNNFLVSETKKITEGEGPDVKRGRTHTVKEISESGSKTAIIFSEWGNNFRSLFLTDNNKLKEGYSKIIEQKIAELFALSEVEIKEKDNQKFIEVANGYIDVARSIGIELTEQGFHNYLDENGSKAFNFEQKKENLFKAINRTRFVLNKTASYYKKESKYFDNQFESQSIFKELAKSEAFFVPEGSDASVWTSGKNKWLYSYPSYLSTRILQWKKDPQLLQDWYDSSAYTRGSELAKYLLALDIENVDKFGNKLKDTKGLEERRRNTSEERLAKLNLGIFNAFQEVDGTSIATNDISFNDYVNDHVNKVLSSSYTRTTTPADKSTDYQLRSGFFLPTTTIDEDRVTINDKTLEIFFNYFNSEFNRMKEAYAEVDAAMENPENLRIFYHFKDGSDPYSRTGNAFKSQYFPELSFDSESTNPEVLRIKEKLYNKDGTIKHTSNLSLNNELKEDIKQYINKQLSVGLNETVEFFLEQKIIKVDDNGEFANNDIDKNIFKKYVQDNLENHNDAVISAASDFYINGIIQNIEYSKLFTGDLAFYKNMVDYKKRIPGTYTDGLQLRLKKGEESFTIASISSIKIQSPIIDKLVETLGEEGAKPYKNINSADGQAWITPARWKFLLEKTGKWSDAHDTVYRKMTKDTHPEYSKEELKIMAQPLKGVYFYLNGKTPTYLKYSQAVLTKGFVKGTGLETIFNKMTEKGKEVDELITVDGIKVGSPTPTTIHNEDGTVKDDFEFNRVSLANAGWKLQQDLPIKTFKETDVGSQIQKNIFAGLKFNRKLKNFNLEGTEVSGQKVIDDISSTVRALIDKGIADSNKEFGIDRNGKIRNINTLYGALIRELESRGGSKNVIDALRKETALYGIPQAMDKIISIYSSIMNDRLVKIKTNGGAFIQMSNFGISKDDTKDQGIIWSPALENGDTTFEPTKYVNEETGKVTIRPGGILISGSFIAKHIPDYKKYTPLQLFGGKDKDGNVVEGIIDKQILENIVGYRIPNQGLSSNDALQIVGILPEENGDTIVAYTGITTKTGSDFDIDKMFIMMANYTFEEGKLKYTKFDPNLPKSRQSKEALQNRLIEAYKAVLTNEKVIKDVMKPVDIEFIKDEINLLFEADTNKPMFHLNSIDDIRLRYEFIGGKAGVGQEANALVDINRLGYLSLNQYYMGWGHSQMRAGKKETVFDKEFSEPLSEKDLEYYADQFNFETKKDRDAFKESLSKVKTADSLTAILNAFVDIAKDPYITRGNWTKSTTNVGNLMLRAGIHPLYVVNFLAQPVIKEYIDFQSGLESITAKFSGDKKNKFRRKIAIDSFKLLDENNPIEGVSYSVLYQKILRTENSSFGESQMDKGRGFIKKALKKAKHEDISEERIESILETIYKEHQKVFSKEKIDITNPKYDLKYFREQITGTPNSAFQLAVYDKFLELQDISKSVRENVEFSKLDTNGMGKNINSLYSMFNLRQNILNKENKEPKSLNGLDTKLYNTPLGHYFSSLKQMMRIVKANPNLFPQGQQKVQDMFNVISDDIYDMPAVNEELTTDLEKNYYTYVMSYFNPFNMSKDEAMELINELPNKIKALKKNNRGKYLMIDELQVTKEGKGQLITMNNRKKPTSFEEKFTDSWRDLMLDNPKLAEDLIKYAFVTSGFRMNATQFYTYIPNEYLLKEGINYFVPSFSKQEQTDFIDKFYLNNTHKYKYVPLVFKDEMVASKETVDSAFIKKEPGKSRFYVQTESGKVYKLDGYDIEDRAIYTRVMPLGKKVKGSVIVEYGDSFITRNNPANPELIKAFKGRVIKERDRYTERFVLEEIESDHTEGDENATTEQVAENVVPTEVEPSTVFEEEVEEKIETPAIETSNLEGVNSMSEITNHSGGAYGADTYWDIIGRQFGVTEHKHYREGANKSLSQKLRNSKVEATVITKEELEKARIEVERLLGKKFPNTIQGNLQVRNYYQVANSDGVFAIARLNIDKGFESTSVFGGTNTAVQLGIKMNKPVYVWNIATEGWYKWNGSVFQPTDTPILTKDFAGVGTRDIENYNIQDKETGKWTPRQEYLGNKKEQAAKQAIADVYEKTAREIDKKELIKEEVEEVNENPIEIGRAVKYKDTVYIVTQELPGNKVQIYNPGIGGASSKLAVKKDNVTPLKEKAKIVTYLGAEYIVTPKKSIISMKTNKIMNWVENDKSRKDILALANNDILSEPKIDTANIITETSSTSGFTPANKQQSKAIKKIKNFIDKGDPDDIFLLEGKAGTGKTTLVQEAIEDAISAGKKVYIGAISHKAKTVLGKKLNKRYPKKVVSLSVAGLLGMKMNEETGEFTEIGEKAPIGNADIVIIDEASMINEEAFSHIMGLKNRGAKVIFLGDRGQLPPIRKDKSDDISIVFQSENKASLTERVRQGEESPILPFADYYWDNSEKEKAEYNPVPIKEIKDKLSDKGNLVFASKMDTIFDQVVDTFRRGIDEKNPELIKIVTYRNKTREKYNKDIREQIFGKDVEHYIKSDFIMFQDNYESEEAKFSNSDEFVVEEVERDTIGDFKVFRIGVKVDRFNDSIKYFYTLDPVDKEKFESRKSELFAAAKALPYGNLRSMKMSQAWAFSDRFAKIDHSYAITSHKSQGSTYENVIVDSRDINSVGMITNKTRSRAIYTALTRASDTAIVIHENATTNPKNISKALDVEKYASVKNLWDEHSEALLSQEPSLTFERFKSMPKIEQDKLIECYGKQ